MVKEANSHAALQFLNEEVLNIYGVDNHSFAT